MMPQMMSPNKMEKCKVTRNTETECLDQICD